jgi:phosphopantetheinyl transferase
MKKAAEIAPLYYSLGNHELGMSEENAALLKNSGIRLLDDDFVTVEKNIHIGGLTSGYVCSIRQAGKYAPMEPNFAFLDRFSRQKGFKILLCHHPEYYPAYLCQTSVDLIVSGHAHGGQWKVFGHGVVAPGQGLFPKYCSGIYDDRLSVSCGMANTVAIPRFFNPREIVLLNVQPQEKEGFYHYTLYYTEEKTESEAFIRRAVSDYTKTDCSHAEILHEPMGKPFFADPSLPFFSLSHSGNCTVCAVGPAPCGVDIQEHLFHGQHRSTDEILRIGNRFFHSDEAERLNQASADEIPSLFFDIWTAKESYVKYTGEGISKFKTFSALDPFTHAPAVIKKVTFCKHNPSAYYSLFLTAEEAFTTEIKEL